MTSRTPAIDSRDLAPPVSRLLGRDKIAIVSWSIAPLTYHWSAPISGGVYRIAGSAEENGHQIPWSLVLKVVQPPNVSNPRIGDWPSLYIPQEGRALPPSYWEREPLAYQSGILEDLPDGLSAPRCFGVVRKSPTAYWLWLEDLVDAHGGDWTLPRYVQTAQQLGRFNGSYLVGRPLPDAPWLRSGGIRAWLDEVDRHGEIERIIEAGWTDPLIRQTFPWSMVARLQRCWSDREIFLAALDCLPQTLRHGDIYPANLLACTSHSGHKRLVAVDWAEVEAGPVGEDIALLPIVQDPSGKGRIRPAQMDGPIFRAYMHGLQDVGWRGDERAVRLGYAGSVILRKGCLDPAILLMQAVNGYLRGAVERRGHDAVRARLAQEAEAFSFALDLADEARELMQCSSGGLRARR
jgi:hypothetical protein